MSLDGAPELQAFRREVAEYLAAAVPEDIRKKCHDGGPIPKADHVRWQRILNQRGWLAPNWSAQWGGPGWDAARRFIFDEEYHLASAPKANLIALDLLGPVLIEFGTQAQKERFLPGILTADDWWCQGFSEPGAGSDLASLATRADRDGDCYVINGTKLWTSYAHDADWMFCLCRTSREEAKQAGISFILLPMTDPGVRVSPILTLAGIHTVNEVVLENVRVPTANLVGAEGQAWEITRFLLGHERLVGAGLGPSGKLVRVIRDLATRKMYEGAPMARNAHFMQRLALLEISLLALRHTAYQVLAEESSGKAPGPEVSILKLKGAELQQNLTELLMEMGDANAVADPATFGAPPALPGDELYLAYQYFDRRKVSIYGGASEIQKNIIARRILNV